MVVVLVRARNPANIGAVARAMHDLGYSQLRVVNKYPVPFQAARSAVDAADVLASAMEPATVSEAVADCTLVLGTTAVGERTLQHPVESLETAAGRVQAHLKSSAETRVALLFGSEKTGLSNEELSHCHGLLTIPMNPLGEGHLSMNLGQAVAVCLYRLTQAGHSVPLVAELVDAPDLPALAGDQERLTQLLLAVLERSGYSRRHPANVRTEVLRRLLRRMALNAADAPVWTGMLRQLLHALEEKR